ncbi:TonB family protein [Cryomorpha ignava]|uniref:TonB family protein n=1 Tax=Cryomorpha ignava TaxID=101383 RepID=A0A7K3WS43_9FLAO|nr:TonB family protein [Cryomorpha ignava]NEN23525.1 TonB family protein [Cryomorpha ignava]
MRLALNNIERVEIYLNNELNAQDRKEFENELTTNGELAETLAEVRLLRKAINRKELRSKIDIIRRKGGMNSTLIIGLIGLAVILTTWALWPNQSLEESNNTSATKTEVSTEISTSGENILGVDSFSQELMDQNGNKISELGGKKLYVTPDIQKFSFKSDDGATIVGKDGMLIIVPKNAFIDETGKELRGEVELLLVEAFGVSEMVLYNLHTVSNGSVLESGGMFYTETTIDGRPVKINPKRPLYIEIPTPESDTEMRLFQGEVKPDGSINWVDPKPLEQFLVTVPLSELDFLPEGFANEVSANMPFLSYEKTTNTVVDSLYYSLNWGLNEIPKADELLGVDETASGVLQDCGIDPASIETIKKAKFQNSFIATKAFEERIKVIHKAQNGDALLQIYIRDLDKDLYVCDALVAQAAGGNLKKVFEEFAKQNLGNIKDAALYSDRLQAYYVKRRKELRDIHNRISADYNEKNQTKLELLAAKRDGLSSSLPASLNPSTVRQSSSNVFATQWASAGWGNIDKYMMPQLTNNSREVAIEIENESENADVNVWLGEINTYTGLVKNAGKYRARFPKRTKNSVSHVFAIEQTPDGYNWGYKNFDSKLENEIHFAMASADIDEIKTALLGVEMNFGRLKNRLGQINANKARQEREQREIVKKREARRIEMRKLTEAYNAEVARQKEITDVISKLREVAFPCNQSTAVEVEERLPVDTTSIKLIEQQVFTIVEQMPSFPGGDKAMMKFLQENIAYPAEAKNNGISGTVYVTFVIDADGSLGNPRILRSVSPDIDAEALRVIGEMPNWTPGRQRGSAVPVQYNLPIIFTLRK